MDEYGVATDKTTVHMQKLLPASVDVVWEYLTQSDKRATWLASGCLLYTSPSPRDQRGSRMPSSA